MHNTHWKIVAPCAEPFEKMDVTSRGLYCHRCEKEVFDLDGKTAEEVGYKKAGDICGRITVPATVATMPLGKWSSFMLKWLGVTALLFIPLKKGNTHFTIPQDDDHEEEKVIQKIKRLVGTIYDENNRPLRTKVRIQDSEGIVLAQTMSLANGRYLLQLDTPAVKTDSTLTITAVDTTQKIVLPASVLWSYTKDSFHIGPMIGPYISGGVAMKIDVFNFPKITGDHTYGPSLMFFETPPENAGDALEQEARAGIRGIEKA